MKVTEVEHGTAEKLFKVLQESKLPPPPTDCLAPIGVQQLLWGMFKGCVRSSTPRVLARPRCTAVVRS